MEEATFQSPLGQPSYTPQRSGKSKKFLFLIIFLILLVGAGFAVSKFFFGAKPQKEAPVITPTPTEYQFPTDTPTPATPTEKPETTTAPTSSPTVNPVDKTTGLDRSTLSVEVQNGSGETGVASKGSDTLKSFGYKVIATGNADNFNYENVTIKVKSTKTNFLALLKKDLGFSYTVGSASADLVSSSTADALVIIGK